MAAASVAMLLVVVAGLLQGPARRVLAWAGGPRNVPRARMASPEGKGWTAPGDPQLRVEIGPQKTYVLLENSRIQVRYEPYTGGHGEFVIRDFILKTAGNLDQAGVFLDADSNRGALVSARILHDGPDHKRVQLAWQHKDDPGKQIVHRVAIYAHQPFLEISYAEVRFGNNMVDQGRPGDTNNGVHVAHGGAGWVRGYVAYPQSYYNRYPPDGVDDPPHGGTLNYNGHFIVGVYDPANGIGYGRVMPISDTDIVKLLQGDSRRKGFEFFHHGAHGPFTGYLFGVTGGGASEVLSLGRQLADRNAHQLFLPLLLSVI